MNLFSSKQEKKYWFWALFVQFTLYATLDLANKLSGMIANFQWFDVIYSVCMMLIVISAVIIGSRNSPSKASWAIRLFVVAVYLLVFVRMNIPQERTHLIEYGVVAILVYEALKIRRRNTKKPRFPAPYAIVITSFLGVIDEVIQFHLPNRVFDVRDIIFNVLAAIMAVLSVYLLNRVNAKNAEK